MAGVAVVNRDAQLLHIIAQVTEDTQADAEHFALGDIGFDLRQNHFRQMIIGKRTGVFDFFNNRAHHFSLALGAHKVGIQVTNATVNKGFVTVKFVNTGFHRFTGIFINKVGFRLRHFHLHAAEFIDNRRENIKIDHRVTVNLNAEIILDCIHQ